ncbi:MAG: replicative DNA helicase [Acidobacteriota bacterium]|nr:replicative DNA helicase [Acidobacteriota bacterium]
MSPSSVVETLPHADEAERSLLGAILLDAAQYDKARELISGASFYSLRHQKIFSALETMIEAGSAPDIVVLKDELERRQELQECGGPAYLASLMDGIPRSAHVEHYARIVREKSVLRDLIRTTQAILSSAVQPTATTDELVDEAEKAIFQVSENRLGSGFVPLRVAAEESLRWIEELTERQELITGVATGYPQLDEMTSGLQNSDLVILAARPSMGKTALAINMALHAATQHGKRVGIFSLEMSHQQLFLRMLCSEGQIDAHRLRTGRINEVQWQKLISVYGRLSELPIFIDDSPGVSIMEMRAKSRRLAREHGLDMIVVDYLQLMQGSGRYTSRQQEISDISRSLKELAKELNTPMLALSQLSRAPEQRSGDHRPQLSDLRESGAIEQDADVVMFLFREEVYNKEDPNLEGKAELIIGKQRNGPTGTVHLNFIRQFTRFVNPEYREF